MVYGFLFFVEVRNKHNGLPFQFFSCLTISPSQSECKRYTLPSIFLFIFKPPLFFCIYFSTDLIINIHAELNSIFLWLLFWSSHLKYKSITFCSCQHQSGFHALAGNSELVAERMDKKDWNRIIGRWLSSLKGCSSLELPIFSYR